MTLNDIKAASLAKGHNFFTPEIKGAYKTRYSKRTAEGPGGVYFVTSEEIPSPSGIPERRFAVRSFNPVSGAVELVSALGQYATDYAAHTAAKALANPNPVVEAALPEHTNEAPPAANEATTAIPVEPPASLTTPSVAEVLAACVAVAGPEGLAAIDFDGGPGAEIIPFPVAKAA